MNLQVWFRAYRVEGAGRTRFLNSQAPLCTLSSLLSALLRGSKKKKGKRVLLTQKAQYPLIKEYTLNH